MKLTWKKLALCVAAALTLCVFSAQSFAQEAANKFAELLPKMAPQNMADEGQVKDMEASQQAWMNYCLQDCAKDAALRAESIKVMCDALDADTPVVAKQWLLHVLQWVGDDSCVDCVAKQLKADDARLVDGAARALAQIPTEKALDALKVDADKFASYIKARNVDITVGQETELPLALPTLSDADFAKYMADFDKLSADDQARALGAVRVRKDKAALALCVKCVDSDNEQIKRAALLAIEKIGSAEQFPLLYKAMKEFDRNFVVRIMQNIVGDDFDAATIAALQAEKDADTMGALAEVVGGRYISKEVATLLALANKADCPNRLAVMSAAEKVATKANIGDFVDASLALTDRGERDRAEQIVARLCEGDATPVIAKMNNDNGQAIFLLIGRVGGDAAHKQMDAALATNDANMKALAVRAMCNWPNAVVWKQLMDAVKDASYPEQLRIQALRAYIRVVSLPTDQDGIGMPNNVKLQLLKEAFELATRDDERNFVLERVGAVREPESVEFALQFVDNKELSNKAINAILDLAHQDYLRKANKDLFIKALDVVLEKGDKDQKNRAENYKSNIR